MFAEARFLQRLANIVSIEGLLDKKPQAEILKRAKQAGFSDAQVEFSGTAIELSASLWRTVRSSAATHW